jgi:hypothetical protein
MATCLRTLVIRGSLCPNTQYKCDLYIYIYEETYLAIRNSPPITDPNSVQLVEVWGDIGHY